MSANLFPSKKMTPQQVGLLSAAVPSPFGDALGLLADAAGYAQDPKSLTPTSGLLSLAAMAPGIPSKQVLARRAEVDKVLSAYSNRSKALFTPDGAGRAGNSWSAAFWAGYDGLKTGPRVPPRSAISYAWYMAGKAAKKTASELPEKSSP